MNNTNLDQALAALADALKSQSSVETDPQDFIKSLPNGSLSGDKISGGKITRFSSAGITDSASQEQILITNDVVTISKLKVSAIKENLVIEGNLDAKIITADVLNVREIKTDIKLEKDSSLIFSGDKIHGKGLLWMSKDYNKQFVFTNSPDRLFSSETIDINKGKHLSVAGVMVLNDQELGPTVTKSNLQEVGVLRGLMVTGDININQYLFYNSTLDRIGLGTDLPHAALSVSEMGTEVMLGTNDNLKGMVGTFGPIDFNIVTDNTSRISITATGNINLGNLGSQVTIQSKLSVGVKNPDPRVDLHVAGAVRLNNHIQTYDTAPPTEGNHTPGDIVWNSVPGVGQFIGWVCTRAGNPGSWNPFGEIKEKK